MKEFEPRPYQKEVLDRIATQQKIPPIIWPPRRWRNGDTYNIGVDLAQPGGDKTVIAHSLKGRNGKTKIWFDEVGEWPNYKWYRNPIKAYKWRRTMKRLMRHSKGKFLYTGTNPREINKLRRK